MEHKTESDLIFSFSLPLRRILGFSIPFLLVTFPSPPTAPVGIFNRSGLGPSLSPRKTRRRQKVRKGGKSGALEYIQTSASHMEKFRKKLTMAIFREWDTSVKDEDDFYLSIILKMSFPRSMYYSFNKN